MFCSELSRGMAESAVCVGHAERCLRRRKVDKIKAWQDADAELKLKRAFNNMFVSLKIPALLIRSVSLKAISALKDLGLKLSGDAEIDLIMAFVSGDFLHLVVCEVKRADTYPWQTKSSLSQKNPVLGQKNPSFVGQIQFGVFF